MNFQNDFNISELKKHFQNLVIDLNKKISQLKNQTIDSCEALQKRLLNLKSIIDDLKDYEV